jgi:hypothetical protein
MAKTEVAGVFTRRIHNEIGHFTDFAETMSKKAAEGHVNWMTLKS